MKLVDHYGGGVIRDFTTNNTVVRFTDCCPYSKAFQLTPGYDDLLTVSAQVSKINAVDCPESLGITQEEYEEEISGKIVLWTETFSTTGGPTKCGYNFYYPMTIYNRVSSAGGIALVLVDSATGSIPGIWRGTVPSLEDMPVMPFMQCSSRILLDEQDTLLELRQTMSTSTIHNTTWNATLTQSNINQWVDLFSSSWYQGLFRYTFPSLFILVGIFGMYVTWLRVSTAIRSKDKSSESKWPCIFTAPIAAIVLETLAMFAIGGFQFYDGQWSVDALRLEARSIFMGQLIVTRVATTVLVGLALDSLYRAIANDFPTGLPFSERKRGFLFVVVCLLLAIEIIATVLRLTNSVLAALGNMIATLPGYLIILWFWRSAGRIAKLLKTMKRKDEIQLLSQDALPYIAFLERVVVLARVLSISLLIVIVVTTIVISWIALFWKPIRWVVFWVILDVFQVVNSVAKLALLLPAPRYSKVVSSATHTSAGAVASGNGDWGRTEDMEPLPP